LGNSEWLVNPGMVLISSTNGVCVRRSTIQSTRQKSRQSSAACVSHAPPPNLFEHLVRQVDVEEVLGVVIDVLGLIIVELALRPDLERWQRAAFEHAHRQLQALDVLLDQCLPVPADDRVQGVRRAARFTHDVGVHAAPGADRLDHDRRLPGGGDVLERRSVRHFEAWRGDAVSDEAPLGLDLVHREGR